MKSPAQAKWLLGIIVLLVAALACTCSLPANLGWMTNQPDDEIPLAQGLNLDPRGADGLVSGAFLNTDGQVTRFSVTADGTASYHLDGAPPSLDLTIAMPSTEGASMTWAGISMDGYGEKDSDQLSMLANLMDSDMAFALVMTPLDLACLEEGQIDPQQLAALLFPLQVYYKYQLTNRSAISQAFINVSKCNYGINPESQLPPTNQIYLTPANPVPVVLGYFPFDAEGAVEAPHTSQNPYNLASLNPNDVLSSNTTLIGSRLHRALLNDNEPIVNQWGPCEAKCRGACGADCTSNNCRMEIGSLCEKDWEAANTGMIEQVKIYTCGLHPACIKHDACYDTCNAYWGCDSWDATYCRHGGWRGMENPGSYLAEKTFEIARGYALCDLQTVAEERFINVIRWVEGFGPQPIQQVYIYSDESYQKWYDPVACPIMLDLDEEQPADQDTVEDPPIPSAILYEGYVSAKQAMLEVTSSQVELKVDGDLVSVTVGFTFKSALKWDNADNVVCTGTMTRVYSGQTSMASPLEITLSLASHADQYDGPNCSGVSAPAIQQQTLVGQFFNNGTFQGNIRNVWDIFAVLVE
jgi:hypothetical protein